MKKLVIALVVLLVLLVGADRVAEQVAEGRIAQQLAAELAARPTVEIGGFPFLTQALRGRYQDIAVSGDSASRQGVRVTDFRAHLEGVRVPLSDALAGRVGAVPVDQVRGTALVSYADFAHAANVPGLQLAPAGDQVRVSGPVQVLGQDLTVSALSDVRLDGTDVVLTAQRLEVGGQQVSGPVSAALSGRLDLRVPTAGLPYDLVLTDVRTTERGIELSGTARDVVLQR